MTMTIERALSKLEAKAADVLRCDWCLYAVASPSLAYDTGDTPPDKLIPVTCRWCGWRVVYGVQGLSPREVEALRIYLTAGAEDRFRDPRVYAAENWYPQILNGRKWLALFRRVKETGEDERPRRVIRAVERPDRARKQAEEAKRDREALKARGVAFVRRMHAREKKLYGPHPFTLAAEVKAITSERVPPSVSRYRIGGIPSGAEYAAREALKCFRAAELCEAVLWGGTLEETRDALAELAPAVEAFDAERERERVEQEREAAEREERWRRREEEDRRRVLERTGAPSITAAMGIAPRTEESVPASRFRNPAPIQPHNSAVIDPEAVRIPDPSGDVACRSIPVAEFYDPNHPDAVQFQRSTPPDPDARADY